MTAIESSLEPIWVWVIGAVGVACLAAAVLVSVLGSRRRTKTRTTAPPPPPNGAPARLPRSNRPSGFRMEPGETPAGAPGIDDAGGAEARRPPPPAEEWMALWAAPKADHPAHPADVAASTQAADVASAEAGWTETILPTQAQPPSEFVPPGPPPAPDPEAPHVPAQTTTPPPPPSVSAWPVIPPPPPSALSMQPAAAGGPRPVPGLVAIGSDDLNLRGVLRWLLFETDADATAFLQVAPGGEQLFIEPRGLADASVADLARRAREAMVAAAGERAAGDVSTARWLGVGGSKLLLLTGASPVAAAEPLRFARFAIEWLAGSLTGDRPDPTERTARAMPGVAWAELGGDDRLRVLSSEQQQEEHTRVRTDTTRTATRTDTRDDALMRALPGQMVHWVVAGHAEPEHRARLVDVNLIEIEGTPSAEVRLIWEGSELRGIGRGHMSLAGRYLAAARAAIDALKPLVHGKMHVENLQVSTLPSDVEVVLVSVLVGEERLVGATLVRPEDEARAGAKAVLDAVNRRLVVLAGQSGQI